MSYNLFNEKAKTLIKYNSGKSIENILKQIFVKYINKDLTNNDYIKDLIESVNNTNDISELRTIIDNFKINNQITETEYNYYLNLLKDKENEIL